MKYVQVRRLPALLLLVALSSCGKTNSLPGTASLTIVNAVAGNYALATQFSNDTAMDWSAMIFFANYQEFSSYSGIQPLVLYQVPDTLPKSTPLFALTLNLPINTIHSLFLTGTSSFPDTVFTTDAPPFHPASDSSMGIRFINLSPGSAPVSVDIQGQANGSEAASLPYKSITAFRNYPATAAVSAYTFEFRDAASGTLLASYAMTLSPYRNFTIALEGLPGVTTGATAQAAYLVNNY